MTDTQILDKAISKARGYPFGCIIFPSVMLNKEYYRIIFSFDFAKAFWGSEDVDDQGRTIAEGWEEEYKDSGLFMDKEDYEYGSVWNIAYHYHLKQMVMCEEPLKYLEKFLDE